MIVSGQRSYYEEYVRRKDTERAFAKPPALLTDRNAYINFLEVQLERVSAACLGVQSYEDRFNDMQGLIVSLDERVASTAKLVSLAQQCTEEVRSEAHQRHELEAQASRTIRNELHRSVQAVSHKMELMEHSFSSFPRIEGRLNAMEKRIADLEESLRQTDLDHRVALQGTDARVAQLETVKDELFALLESNRAAVSRVAFDVEENNTRVNAYMSNVEERVNQALADAQDRHQQEMSGAQARWAVQTEELRRLIEAKDAEAAAASRRQFTLLTDEIDALRRNWAQDRDTLEAEIREYSDLKVSRLQQAVTQSLSEVRTTQTKQAGFMCDLEESLSAQLDTLQSKVLAGAEDQTARHAHYTDTHKTIDAQLQGLRASVEAATRGLHEVRRVQAASGGSHWHAGGQEPGPALEEPGGGSFLHYPPPLPDHRPSAPMNREPRESMVLPRPVAGYPRSGATSPHARAPADQESYRADPAARAAWEGSQRTTSPSMMTAQPPGALSTRGKQKSQRRDDPVDESAVDIVQKFLQIYEADQREVAKRLDRLGAAKAPRSNSALRRRLRSATAAVRQQQIQQDVEQAAPAPPLQHPSRSASGTRSRSTSAQRRRRTAGTEPAVQQPTSGGRSGTGQRVPVKGKTPGEILSRFFLNYKKDRRSLLDRMKSLEKTAITGTEDRVKDGHDAERTREDTDFDPIHTTRSALRANSQAFWQREAGLAGQEADGEGDGPSAIHPSADDSRAGMEGGDSPASVSGSASVASSDPAAEAVEALLSRSMDNFMRSFRDQRSFISRARPSPHSPLNASARRREQVSPQRLSRTASLFEEDLNRTMSDRNTTKRYMQPTESVCLSRAQSPHGDVKALAAAAETWIKAPVTQRPVWKVNTYSSPDRARTSPGARTDARAHSISPGARTAASLIDRLVRQDRSGVLFTRVQSVPQNRDSGLRSSHDSGGSAVSGVPVSVESDSTSASDTTSIAPSVAATV